MTAVRQAGNPRELGSLSWRIGQRRRDRGLSLTRRLFHRLDHRRGVLPEIRLLKHAGVGMPEQAGDHQAIHLLAVDRVRRETVPRAVGNDAIGEAQLLPKPGESQPERVGGPRLAVAIAAWNGVTLKSPGALPKLGDVRP